MIGKEELEQKADELSVHTSHVQRDYVFGWLLSGIYSETNELRNRLILKGGNCFRKAYFEHARYSNDLDFSTQSAIDLSQLGAELNKACQYVGENTGIEFALDENRVDLRNTVDGENNLYEARVYFRGFYGEESYNIKVKLDIKEFDRIFLPLQTRNIIHAYSDAAKCKGQVVCHKLEELLASKLKALLQRRHSPDLYDFIFSIFFQKLLNVNRLEVVTTFLKKTIYERDPIVARNLLLELPFQAIRTIWNEYLVCPKPSLISFDDAEIRFKSIIAELFATFQPVYAVPGGGGFGRISDRRNLSYFSSSHRNTIVEAGQAKKMVRMMYDGLLRMVEPYALSYKVRKDGVGREYFYGRDIAGGRSGEFGIKSYTEDKVQSIEMTDQLFEPRFPIELSKAGEYFGRSYFGRPFSQRTTSGQRPRLTRRNRHHAGVNYTVQCSVCGKRFKRSTYSTKLNKHKDRFGNQCFGRYGFIV